MSWLNPRKPQPERQTLTAAPPTPDRPGPMTAEEEAEAAVEREAWLARRQAAIDAVPLPENPYCIRHHAMERHWRCYEAVIEARKYTLDQSKMRRDTSYFYLSMSVDPLDGFDAEAIRDDPPVDAVLYWQGIGPPDLSEPDRVQASRRYGWSGPVLPFSTFDEAQAWLKAYLKPIAEEVFFTPTGELV